MTDDDQHRPLYTFGVALTTLLCATLCARWAHPGESFSGLIGRWLCEEVDWRWSFARRVAPVLDNWVHVPLGVETCVELYELETAARDAVYRRRKS